MCGVGGRVLTPDGDLVCEACGACDVEDVLPERAGHRGTKKRSEELASMLEGAAALLGTPKAVMEEAGRILEDRRLWNGRTRALAVAGALYWASTALKSPRTVADVLGWHPDVPRAPDYVELLCERTGTDGEGRQAARRIARAHAASSRSPIVVAATALAAAGVPVKEAARAAGVSQASVHKCLTTPEWRGTRAVGPPTAECDA